MANIKAQEGGVWTPRKQTFTRLIKEVTVAARNGRSRSAMNPRLRSRRQGVRTRTCPRTRSSARTNAAPAARGRQLRGDPYGYGRAGRR